MIEKTVSLAILILFPPLLHGVINRTKAVCAGRDGAPILQPYYDLAKLFRKGITLSGTTTWIFTAGPAVTLLAVFTAGLLIPLGPFGSVISFHGDLFLFAYLFALARFFTTAAALDTGSAFEGMGAAREVTFACLSEPALFFSLIVLSKITGMLSLCDILNGPVSLFQAGHAAPLILTAMGLFIVLLAETCRIRLTIPTPLE
jgi:formate hydrogenlyase subunit 4